MDAEAELVVVIGERARRVGVDAALSVVSGYTCANDVSARDLQSRDGQWLRSKSFDSFCPLLPAVVPVETLGDGGALRTVQRLRTARRCKTPARANSSSASRSSWPMPRPSSRWNRAT